MLALVGSTLAFRAPVSKASFVDAAVPLLAASVLFTGSSPAFADDATIGVGTGERIFQANCAACHGGGRNVIMPSKTLEKEALEEYLDGGFNEAAVVKQVTNGKNAMPAFGGRLSDSDIASVASFVIKTSAEGWD